MRMALDDYIDLKVIFLSAHEKTDKQQLPRNLNISLELHMNVFSKYLFLAQNLHQTPFRLETFSIFSSLL